MTGHIEIKKTKELTVFPFFFFFDNLIVGGGGIWFEPWMSKTYQPVEIQGSWPYELKVINKIWLKKGKDGTQVNTLVYMTSLRKLKK